MEREIGKEKDGGIRREKLTEGKRVSERERDRKEKDGGIRREMLMEGERERERGR